MKTIRLTDGSETLVDDLDYRRLSAFIWTRHVSGYAVRRVGSARRKTLRRIWMAKVILGVPNSVKVDHRDRNRLNNQRLNLRTATNAQNSFNSVKPRRSTIRFRGVWKAGARSSRFSARIQHNGKNVYLGTFNTQLEAAKAYDSAARRIHADFAVLNFPSKQRTTGSHR